MTILRQTTLHNENGYVLIGSFLLGVLFVSLGVASLMYTERELKSTGQFERGKQTMATAESGALHALGTINAKMVKNFKTDIVDRWGQSADLLGSSSHSLPFVPGASYAVKVEADPSDPMNLGIIVARGRSASGDRSGVRIRVKRRFSFKWGAIYLANNLVQPTFKGNSLHVDGTNYKAFAAAPAGDGLEVPGIGTRSTQSTKNLRDALSGTQMNNVEGLGPEPSILNSGGPSPADMTAIRMAILGLGGHVTYAPNGGGNLSGDLVMGTPGAPQISYVQSVNKITGNIQGAGILIIDSNVEVQFLGNITWTGWILVNGSLTMGGSSTVQGTVWASDIKFTGGGNMTAHFCIECIQLATDKINLDLLPSKVRAIGWEELPWDEL